MKKHEVNCVLTEFENNELDKNQQDLLRKAHQACEGAYAPYSLFKVGASLVLENEEIISGSNQENVAYPSGLCAERVAIFNAGANHPNQKIKRIAIVAHADFDLNKAVMPCGACRQSMIEYEQRQGEKIEILLQGNKGNIFISNSVSNLLPYAFECEELKKS